MDEHQDFGISEETVETAVTSGAPVVAMMYRALRDEGLSTDEAARVAAEWFAAS